MKSEQKFYIYLRALPANAGVKMLLTKENLRSFFLKDRLENVNKDYLEFELKYLTDDLIDFFNAAKLWRFL
jgi:hypothetical protein